MQGSVTTMDISVVSFHRDFSIGFMTVKVYIDSEPKPSTLCGNGASSIEPILKHLGWNLSLILMSIGRWNAFDRTEQTAVLVI